MSKLLLEGTSLKEEVNALKKRVERLELNLTRIVREIEKVSATSIQVARSHEDGEGADDIQCLVS